MRNIALSLFLTFSAMCVSAQWVLAATNTIAAKNFDTLASSGNASTFPNDWNIVETRTNAKTSYAAGTHTGCMGHSDSFSATAGCDRTLSGMPASPVAPSLGASCQYGSGSAKTVLE